MITLIYSPRDWFASEVVYKALIRSFSKSQVRRVLNAEITSKKFKTPGIFVFINPKNIKLSFFPAKSKIIFFGKIDPSLADELEIKLSSEKFNFSEQSIIRFNPIERFYFPISSRPLVRFDFPNEWNNLGFGRINTDDSIWAISENAISNYAVAVIENKNAYITFHDFDVKACIWINREVGLIDSTNWYFIEYFLSEHRFSDLISVPYLLDIPSNVDVAVTMRLDCDEDILSAKQLFHAYHDKRVPFSLAIKTSLSTTQSDKEFLHTIQKSGGAILSHSVNHKVAWGENYYDAFSEAFLSKIYLENHFEINPLLFAVSPFHSNTAYSVKALEDANYAGFIGGIIANDPEYLMARGGNVPFAEKIISHSQQCMLHGDCLLKEKEDPLRMYKNAFDIALESKTFFGYLDHPFSTRYQYGWETEAQRIDAHMELIDYMRYHSDVLFVNENECLNFMIDKSNTTLTSDQNKIKKSRSQKKKSALRVGYSINGQVFG